MIRDKEFHERTWTVFSAFQVIGEKVNENLDKGNNTAIVKTIKRFSGETLPSSDELTSIVNDEN